MRIEDQPFWGEMDGLGTLYYLIPAIDPLPLLVAPVLFLWPALLFLLPSESPSRVVNDLQLCQPNIPFISFIDIPLMTQSVCQWVSSLSLPIDGGCVGWS